MSDKAANVKENNLNKHEELLLQWDGVQDVWKVTHM